MSKSHWASRTGAGESHAEGPHLSVEEAMFCTKIGGGRGLDEEWLPANCWFRAHRGAERDEGRVKGNDVQSWKQGEAIKHWTLTTIPGVHKEAGFIYGTLTMNFLRTKH